MNPETRQALVAAAGLCSGAAVEPSGAEEGGRLLDWLGLSGALGAGDRQDAARLLEFASRMDRLFELAAPDAPGMCAFGAVVSTHSYGAKVRDVASVSGVGPDRASAFRACVAEAVEYVSQFESEDDRRLAPSVNSRPDIMSSVWRELAGDAPIDIADRVASSRGADGRPDAVPGALVYRRGKGRMPNGLSYAMGLGVAAGRTREEAACHAVLEWVERDAVALWWRGGRAPAAIPFEVAVEGGLCDRLRAYRQGQDRRRTWFLDLTTDIGIPVVAALSVDRENRGFAYGFSAGANLAGACCGAFDELCQIELADHVVAAKRRENGDGGLNEVDRKHLARASGVASDWPGLQPSRMAGCIAPEADCPSPAEASSEILHGLVRKLEDCGHCVHLVDLTRMDIAVPVMRAIVAGLQPDPSDLVTARLAAQRRASTLVRIPGDVVALY